MIESREESLVKGKQLLRHSKPEFCILLIMNWTMKWNESCEPFLAISFSLECTMFGANRISKNIFNINIWCICHTCYIC